MELKLKGKLGVSHASKPKGKKTFKSHLFKMFGLEKNKGGGTSRDVTRQANTNIKQGGISNKSEDVGCQATTNTGIEGGSIDIPDSYDDAHDGRQANNNTNTNTNIEIEGGGIPDSNDDGRQTNTNTNTNIETDGGGNPDSNDDGHQANTNANTNIETEGGGIPDSNDYGHQANTDMDTDNEKGGISSPSLEAETEDVISSSTPSKDKKRSRKNSESTDSTPDYFSSPKTPIQVDEKGKQLSDIRTRSRSGFGSGSGSGSGISVADVCKGVCSPVKNRKKFKLAGKYVAKTGTKGSSVKK